MSLCFSAASLHFRRKSPSDIRLEKKENLQISENDNLYELICKEYDLHNIGLVHSSNTDPLIVSGIFESVLCNALAGLLRNELNALYDAFNNLKTYVRV